MFAIVLFDLLQIVLVLALISSNTHYKEVKLLQKNICDKCDEHKNDNTSKHIIIFKQKRMSALGEYKISAATEN